MLLDGYRPGKQGRGRTFRSMRRSLGSVICLQLLGMSISFAFAGTWSDGFSEPVLNQQWHGDRDYFSIVEGALKGVSASPLAPVPLRWVEVGNDWDDYVARCDLNVVTPNLLVCTKGALLLRQSANEGYVFALHVATQTVEVYRLSDGEVLLSKAHPLQLQRWYNVRAELKGADMAFFVDEALIGQISDARSSRGAVGVAVQDALSVLFADFTVSGPNVESNGLSISQSGRQIIVSWPASITGGVIQVTEALTSPIRWTSLTNAPTKSGNQWTLALDLSPGTRFYRLSQ